MNSSITIGRTKSVCLIGLDGYIVDVQAISTMGLPVFIIAGLPDSSLKEATERIRPAFNYCGFNWPSKRVTVNLSPASIPKYGSGFDLAISAALLYILKVIPNNNKIKQYIHVGEVGLDGQIRAINGILPIVQCAVKNNYKNIIVAKENVKEAQLINDANVIGVGSLQELAKFYGNTKIEIPNYENNTTSNISLKKRNTFIPNDLCNVLGQNEAKLALEIAAAGSHHLLLSGVPGAGKSMLASCLPGILPDLTNDDAIEATKIHSVAGTFNSTDGLIRKPPFENPHHTATPPAIIGGGSGIAMPGAVSMAHKGVLFLDEAPEFSASVLQTLRQPLETGEVVIHRAKGSVKYPAQFQLIMAANPCPCGKWESTGEKCICSPLIRKRYFNRISGPLIDRMDLLVEAKSVKGEKILFNGKTEETSAQVRDRVVKARNKQLERLKNTKWKTNSEVPGSVLRKMTSVELVKKLNVALNRELISMRGVDRVLRVAWTIADLAGLNSPTLNELDIAFLFRLKNQFDM